MHPLKQILKKREKRRTSVTLSMVQGGPLHYGLYALAGRAKTGQNSEAKLNTVGVEVKIVFHDPCVALAFSYLNFLGEGGILRHSGD